jgi:hypothetical protein
VGKAEREARHADEMARAKEAADWRAKASKKQRNMTRMELDLKGPFGETKYQGRGATRLGKGG